jgi:TonB family protein
MAKAPKARRREAGPQRRAVRYRVQAPLDVTVLRSGVPDTLPGRAVNLGDCGFGAVLAGEVKPGETVGVEIRLPHMTDPLRMRALVKYHDRLRCGMEFVGLTAEQHALIRDWVNKAKAQPEPIVPGAPPSGKGSQWVSSAVDLPRRKRGKGWIFLLGSGAIFLAVLWWRWNAGWAEIESGLANQTQVEQRPQIHVPAEEMEKLVTHRVDPDYPAAARPANLQGVIVLDVAVSREGTVTDVQALNGPDVLARAATDALRWWRFEPYRVNGQPVPVETTVAVEFKP